jgi:hypothetical protein
MWINYLIIHFINYFYELATKSITWIELIILLNS